MPILSDGLLALQSLICPLCYAGIVCRLNCLVVAYRGLYGHVCPLHSIDWDRHTDALCYHPCTLHWIMSDVYYIGYFIIVVKQYCPFVNSQS